MTEKHPDDFEYNYIADGIYVGTNQCCMTHFAETLAQKEGVTADVSLEEERLDQPFGVEFYAWIPVPDHKPPTSRQIATGVALLQKLVSLGMKVYVHCKNGHGRAPTLVAAYLIAAHGMTAEKTKAFLKERRPSVHFQDSQIKALQTFENAARAKAT
jgi:protein-tyrosine phosphatase